MQCRPFFERQNSDQVDSISEEVKEICADLIVRTEADITKSKWELELYRVSFEPTKLSEVMTLSDEATNEYKK